jgi:ribonuclease HII
VLNPQRDIPGLADSKVLSPRRREQLAEQIKEHALAWAVAWASVEEIDRLNILHASLLAMQRAVADLAVPPQHVLVDGNRCPVLPCSSDAVVGGDRRVACISAASILAKVARDELMLKLDREFPGYGFAQHKGYPSAAHLARLRSLGPTPWHRRSFAPVRAVLAGT